MSQPDDPKLSPILERFQHDWRFGNAPPEIASFLPPTDDSPQADRLGIMIGLILIDLEYRWQSDRGELPTMIAKNNSLPTKPTLEDYVARFPELGLVADLPMELISKEYRVRHQWGDRPTHESFTRRFPKLSPTLRQTLNKIDEELAHPRTSPQVNVAPWDQPTFTHQATASSIDHAERERIRYFGEYELVGEIARGGMGVVFKARQVKLNRIVALKMILSGELAGEEQVQRFKAEAQAAANLDHPGIVPIYEIGEHQGQHYFSMSFIEGRSLNDRVKECPLPSREAATILKKVADAVAYAHSKGVIHRDLKPANVLLDTKGEPKVTDFGLAKLVQSDRDLTRTGVVVGTPSYMPPEQASGKGDIGPTADVYSLGAVLYAMLIGRPPFQSANSLDTIMQVLEREPVPPRQHDSKIERDLETICLKCLAKSPSNRYATATDLRDDICRFLNDQPILARPPGFWERASQWARNHVVTVTTVMALLASSAMAIPLALEFNQAMRPQERQRQDIQAFVDTIYPALTPIGSEAIVQAMSGLIRENPMKASARFDRACAYLAQEKYDLAIEDLSKAVVIDRSRAEYFFARGLVFFRQGNPDKAIDDLTQAIALQPDLASAYLQRAKVWIVKNDLSNALTDASRAIELRPAFGTAYQLRAEINRRRGDNRWVEADLLIARRLRMPPP